MNQCGYCGSTSNKIIEQQFSNGTTHIRLECAQCGKFLRFAPKPGSARAEEFLKNNPEIATMSRSELIELIIELKGGEA